MRRSRIIAGAAVLLAVVSLILVLVGSSSRKSVRASACLYAGTSQKTLKVAEQQLGFDARCVMLFDDAATTWSQWEDPWFLVNAEPDTNWVRFARAGRRMMLTINLFPSGLDHAPWRAAGARGSYTDHARALADNLVRAGMGDAILRLGHEANGTWYADNIGNDAQSEHEWAMFWRRTVQAMRSVPGAAFTFDWCISAGYRAVPFKNWYPGDDVVDTIGVDVYDRRTAGGWPALRDEPGGLSAVARFAAAHHKPLTIPEWGLKPVAEGGDGSDPAFTRGLALFMRREHVTLESYFFRGGPREALLADSESLGLYRAQILH